jgi:hypothetical protein
VPSTLIFLPPLLARERVGSLAERLTAQLVAQPDVPRQIELVVRLAYAQADTPYGDDDAGMVRWLRGRLAQRP